ncbi:arsenite methyltransferase [Nitrospira sp. Kam-Ns4a]
MSPRDLKQLIRQEYRQAALQAKRGGSTCCGPQPAEASGIGESNVSPITGDLYAAHEVSGLPAEALAALLGCGNPTALARLNPGEVVLDLGSGGGIDVLLSAQRVGPSGKAYGLDMTDEMLALARKNQEKAGITNAAFLKGDIEAIPLSDSSVDVVISNCVINLAADKDRVFAEIFRVLRPGGRLALSDVVVREEVPRELRLSVELWIGCVAGALLEREYRDKLAAAGLTDIALEPTRIYTAQDAREFLAGAGLDLETVTPLVDGKFMSAFIGARKPLDRM